MSTTYPINTLPSVYNKPVNWTELTSLFDKNSKTHSLALKTIHFLHNNSIYCAEYHTKKDRIFIHLFDEFSNTYSIDYEEIARGPKDGVLINQRPDAEIPETVRSKVIFNALLTSQIVSNPSSDCVFRRSQSIFALHLQHPMESLHRDFDALPSWEEQLSNLPPALSIWLRLNERINGRNEKVFRHQDAIWHARKENDEGGWRIIIDPANKKYPPMILSCDGDGNLCIDGVKWDDLIASFQDIEKIRLALSLYEYVILGEELEMNHKFAQRQQQAQKPDQPFPVVFLHNGVELEPPDLLGGGDFGLPLSEPAIVRRQQFVNQRAVGVASTIGRKKEMEDTELAVYTFVKTQTREYPIEIFGVYDGHCGFNAATFVRERLVNYLRLHLAAQNPNSITKEGVVKAVKSCYQQLDADFPSDIDGTTAVTAFILNGMLWIANTGDSRAIIVKPNGEIIQASADQKPDTPRHQKIIEELGGQVLGRTHKSVKVNGLIIQLSVARSIGDKRFKGPSGKCVILPDPEITCYPLKDVAGGYLVLACDGIYDNATTEQVGGAIQAMHKRGYSTEKMAKHIVFSSYRILNARDNLTVSVIKL